LDGIVGGVCVVLGFCLCLGCVRALGLAHQYA
jgi:hypothetical protein